MIPEDEGREIAFASESGRSRVKMFGVALMYLMYYTVTFLSLNEPLH